MDPLTEQSIAQVREYHQNSKPGKLIDSQQNSLRDVLATEPVHGTREMLPVPLDTNLIDVIVGAIRTLGDGNETFSVPKVPSIQVEWIDHCSSHGKTDIGTPDSETIASPAMADPQTQTTILYFHGGQFWRMGRATRWITSRLAAATRGRCLAVQYGLSPQRPFPCALAEGLAAYLSLLSPLVGSHHSPVPANNICFAGDSAGGNIAIAVLQLILDIRRKSANGTLTPLVWKGVEVEVPVPAGVAVLSPYVDLTRGLDSEVQNLQYDIIPSRGPPFAGFDRCDVWPAHPPRHHVYADDSALLHPLVSPITAHNWIGAPPIWICIGEECLADQGMFVAQQMARAGARVVLEQYAAMPHNFSLIVPDDKSSMSSIERWVTFIKAAVEDPSSISLQALRWSGNPLEIERLNMGELVSVTLEELKDRMRTQVLEWGSPPG